VLVVNATPRPLYPARETTYPLYRRLGGPQGRSERVRKISPPMMFDPRIVHSVASRYTLSPRSNRTLQKITYWSP